MRRGVSVYSVLPLQRSSFGQAADARVSGLTLHPSAASVPMPAKRHDGSVRPHQVLSWLVERRLRQSSGRLPSWYGKHVECDDCIGHMAWLGNKGRGSSP